MTRLKQARLIGGRYRLVRLLGRGGMSEVWLADDERLGREVAVKLIQGGLEPAVDFERETGILSRLRHPNIVNVYDAGEEDGRRYLVMERVEGASLRDRLRAEGPLPPGEAARVGAAVSAALAYAHARGVLHNDVKPENILIDADGEPRLTDFGAASITGATLDPDGAAQVMGTIAYVAPEVLQGSAPTPPSDVYALGTTLYEALSGRLPYDGRSNAALAGQKVNLPATPLSAAATGVPVGLATAIERALSTEPGGRLPAAEFAAALTDAASAATGWALVAGAPVPARRSTQPLAAAAQGGAGGTRRGVLIAGGLLGAGLLLAGVFALSSGGEPRDDDPEELAGVTRTTPQPTMEPTVAAPTPTSPPAFTGNDGDREDDDEKDREKPEDDEKREDGNGRGNGNEGNGRGRDDDD